MGAAPPPHPVVPLVRQGNVRVAAVEAAEVAVVAVQLDGAGLGERPRSLSPPRSSSSSPRCDGDVAACEDPQLPARGLAAREDGALAQVAAVHVQWKPAAVHLRGAAGGLLALLTEKTSLVGPTGTHEVSVENCVALLNHISWFQRHLCFNEKLSGVLTWIYDGAPL